MAEKKIYIGSVGPFLFDDDSLIDDEDGDFAGVYQKALVSDKQMVITETPSADEHVLRLQDMAGRVLAPVAVSDIDDPSTELGALSGAAGVLVVVYQVGADEDESTLYSWDSAVSTGVDVPFVVAGSSGFWIARAGKYNNDQDIQDTDVEIYGTSYTARDGFDAALRNGIGSGLTVTDEGGLNVSWTEGIAFVDGSVFSVNAAGATGLTNNATNYLYVLKNNSTLQISTTEPDEDVVGEFALVAKYNTYDGDIIHSCTFPLMSGGLRFIIWYFLQKIAPAAVVSGCACSIDTDATNSNDFKIGTGEYFLNPFCSKKIETIIYSAGSGHGANNVQAHFHTASAWDTALENGVNFGYWDNGVQKTAVTGNKWYCGWVYVLGTDTILYVYPQTEHAKEADAQEEEIVYPPYHQGYVLPVARFVFRGSATAFAYNAYFADIRPFLGAVGNGASIQNIYQTVTGDTGSTTATESDDSLAIEGGTGIETEVTADKITISATGGGGGVAFATAATLGTL